MVISKCKVERISHLVIEVLYKRFESFPDELIENRNAPFHEAFLNAFSNKLNGKVIDIPFFISLSSWLHGLNTTLEQTFFEKTAHILSNGEKREFTSKRLGNLKISSKQKDNITDIMTQLSNSAKEPNLIEENRVLFKRDSTAKVNSIDFSCDIFIEDEEEIIAIELKSVKPNSGEMRGEKHKVLEGKTALFENYSDKKISFYLGFPFDPTSEETFGGNKYRFMNSIINCKKYFDKDEILLADELWDFLSGSQNTMKELIGIINAIATIDFTNNYDFLNNKDNRCLDKFQEILENWNLFSELKLIENNELIMLKIKGDRNLTRIYNQKILLSGKYNWHRYYTLSQLI